MSFCEPAFVMALCYLLLIVQMGSMMTMIQTGKKQKTLLWTVPPFLLTMLLLLVLLCADSITGKMVFFLIPAIIYTIWLFLWTGKTSRTTINNNSIKESIDSLPSGIGFSEKDGLVLLANDCMERISYELTGCDYQDADRFWRQLWEGAVRANVQKLQAGSTLAFQTSDGKVWSLEKKELTYNGKEIFQYTATDTTLLYQISEKVQKNNEELTRMNARLQQYGRDMEEYVKSRELLDVKMRVHDKMGQALLATRIWLSKNVSGQENKTGDEKDVQEILKQWKFVTTLMKKESEPQRQEDTWHYITEAADFAGVKLSVEGSFPKNSDTMKLFVEAAAEALTNAVRHGNATDFFVYILHEEKEMHCRFTNNGKVPDQQITESGGLGTLRMRLERAGGRMRVSVTPCFSLEIDLPEGEKE